MIFVTLSLFYFVVPPNTFFQFVGTPRLLENPLETNWLFIFMSKYTFVRYATVHCKIKRINEEKKETWQFKNFWRRSMPSKFSSDTDLPNFSSYSQLPTDLDLVLRHFYFPSSMFYDSRGIYYFTACNPWETVRCYLSYFWVITCPFHFATLLKDGQDCNNWLVLLIKLISSLDYHSYYERRSSLSTLTDGDRNKLLLKSKG